MAARYSWYLLADSPEGRRKEAELTGRPPLDGDTRYDLRQGFVYERMPHITLKSIANNSRIDDIWEKWQATLEPLRASLNASLGKMWEEWEIPRDADEGWTADVLADHAAWWQARIARQAAIDTAIARAAEVEPLYDRPYSDPSLVRVAGPFTVESPGARPGAGRPVVKSANTSPPSTRARARARVEAGNQRTAVSVASSTQLATGGHRIPPDRGILTMPAPMGNKNALRHGHYSAEVIAQRRELAELIRQSRATLAELGKLR
jgi:hypothetical protein